MTDGEWDHLNRVHHEEKDTEEEPPGYLDALPWSHLDTWEEWRGER